ncbi:CapA family protein [Flavobacterium maritimum]|uniref:CapA family protein n=1 Tax=Flavobacterium maritimum TaxID=3149042 RepID=UPI0032B4BD8F
MSDNNITIGFAGDVMIGRGVNDAISTNGYRYPWGNVLPLLEKTDINIINLEAALTNSTKKVYKTFNFKATPDRIETLTTAKVTVANLANNHILDFSEEGLVETIQALNEVGIVHTGAGMNDKEAKKPVILTVKNNRLGILGFTDNEPGWKAGGSWSGINYIDISNNEDCEKALTAIAELRKEADLLIVSIHWGPNMQAEPERDFIDFAHAMIEKGADIIHGHSAHNFQGIEVYHQKLILYDTGDFLDDYAVDPFLRNDHCFLFKVEVSQKRIEKLVLVPVLISHCQVNLATNEEYKWSIERVQKLSAKFGTDVSDNGEVLLF